MTYQYTGNGIEKLKESFDSDKKPFILNDVSFSERNGSFEEFIRLNELLFPNYWNQNIIIRDEIELRRKVSELGQLFIKGVYPFMEDCDGVVTKVLDQLGDIREMLKKDIEAAFAGDPAAKDYTEIIRAYPGFSAILIHRVAHAFYQLKVPSYPRELQELIHSKTGIDIHPGAKLGEYFFIDHGTGVVIGETAETGEWTRLYQQVTLGVLHFQKEGGGVLKKGYKRHPTIGNNVVIGAGAKILGPVTIGDNVNLGANAWIQEDIPSDTTVFITEHPKLIRKERKV